MVERSPLSYPSILLPLFRLIYPFARQLLIASFKIFDERIANSINKVDEVFDQVNKKLISDGRTYLAGTEKPSAADLAFASLAYPLLMPSWALPEILIPVTFRTKCEQYRSSPAGRLAFKMYEERAKRSSHTS
jgi:glutathione S-transferase